MNAAFEFLLVRKFHDGRYEYTAKSDTKPEDRNAAFRVVDSRIQTAAPPWTFEPRISDLPESEWSQIKHIVNFKSGKWARYVNCRSWSLVRNQEGGWALCQ